MGKPVNYSLFYRGSCELNYDILIWYYGSHRWLRIRIICTSTWRVAKTAKKKKSLIDCTEGVLELGDNLINYRQHDKSTPILRQ